MKLPIALPIALIMLVGTGCSDSFTPESAELESPLAEASGLAYIECIAPKGCDIMAMYPATDNGVVEGVGSWNEPTRLGKNSVLGHVGRGTKMGVFHKFDADPSGFSRQIVSYPMADRQGAVQYVDRSDGQSGNFVEWRDLSDKEVVSSPTIGATRPPAVSGVTRTVECINPSGCNVSPMNVVVPKGRKMGVFVEDTTVFVDVVGAWETRRDFVVSYPMADRRWVVQVVSNRARNGQLPSGEPITVITTDWRASN